MDKSNNKLKNSTKFLILLLLSIFILLSGKTYGYNWFDDVMKIPHTGHPTSLAGEAPWSLYKSQSAERTVTYPDPIHYQALENDEEQIVKIHSKAVYCCDLYSHVRSGTFSTKRYFLAEGEADAKTPSGALSHAVRLFQDNINVYMNPNSSTTTIDTYVMHPLSWGVGKRWVTALDPYFEQGKDFFYDGQYGYIYYSESTEASIISRASVKMADIFKKLAEGERTAYYTDGAETSDPNSVTLNSGNAKIGPLVTIMEKKKGKEYGGKENEGYTSADKGTFSNDAKAYVITAIKGLYNGGKEYTLRDIQLAWWRLVDGNVAAHMMGTDPHVGEGEGSEIKNEALAYEKYRKEYLDSNNKLKSSSYSVDSSRAEAIIDQEEQSYTVGPFVLFYPSSYTEGDTLYSFNKFVYVKGLTVRTYDKKSDTNASHTLLYDELYDDFEIIYPKNSYGTTGGSGLTKVYPMSGSPFYVKFYVNGGNGFTACGTPERAEVSFSLEYLTTASCDYEILVSNADQYAYIGHIDPDKNYNKKVDNTGKDGDDYNYRAPLSRVLVDVTYKEGYLAPQWWGYTDAAGVYHHYDSLETFQQEFPGLTDEQRAAAHHPSYEAWSDPKQITGVSARYYYFQPYIQMSKARYDLYMKPQKLMKTEEGERKYITILSSASVDMTMNLGGKVYEDLRRGKMNEIDGYYAITSNTSGEAQDYPMEGVVVILYRHPLNDSLGEKTKGEYYAYTTTNEEGNYSFENLNEMYKYHVEFIYNGQYYEPTKYTLYESYNQLTQNLNGLKRETRWNNSSKALESYLERDELNKKFEEIGASPTNAIPSNGYLQYPTASRDDLEDQEVIDSIYDNNLRKSAGILLNYKIENGNFVVTDNSSKYTDYVKESLIRAYTYESYNDSEIPNYEKKTNDPVLFEDNHVYKSYENNKVDLFLYPISEVFIANNKIKEKSHNEVVKKPIKALYDNTNDDSIDEMHHINLGLVDREEMQLKLEKDVATIYFEVNGKTHMYNYHTRYGFGDTKVGYGVDTRAINGYARYREDLTREIYREDYEYEADLYSYKNLKTIDPVTGERKNMEEKDYIELIEAKERGELEIYVKYKIGVTLNSSLIKTRITEIVDYYDKEFTVIGNTANGSKAERVISNDIITEEEVNKYAPYYGKTNTSAKIDSFENQYAGLSENRINISDISRYKDDKDAKGVIDPEDAFKDEYNRLYIDTEDIYLDPYNPNFTVYVTYRVNKTIDKTNNKRKYVILDEAEEMDPEKIPYIMASKVNIAEINGYKTYYYDRTKAPNYENADNYATGEYNNDDIAGIVDKYSTPGNLEYEKKATMDVSYTDEQGNVQTHKVLTQAEKVAKEADSDMAPLLHIILNRVQTRKILGNVWEDERVDDGMVSKGDGVRQNEEAKINGVIVQLVELDRDNNGKVTEEHVWKEYKTGKTDKDAITSVMNIGVSNDTTQTDEGQYAFIGIPAGDYIVRFIYGADASSAIGTEAVNYETGKVTTDGNPVFKLVNKDGLINLENELFNQSTIYDPTGNMGNKNIHSYTGNDYKSTTYRNGIYEKPNHEYTTNGSEENIDSNPAETGSFEFSFAANENAQNVSDAKDIWSRREIVNNYSKDNLTNHRAEVLSSFENIPDDYIANNMNDLLGELYAYTYMVAESGTIDFEIEYDRTETDNKENGVGTENRVKSGFYEVNGLDFGLERRPRAQLKTTNQVINVKVTLANGNVLFDAKDTATNIQWTKHSAHNPDKENKYDNANNYNVNKMNIPSVRSASGANGVINLTMDEELMQGARIEITYAITVANIGEVDYNTKAYYYKGKEGIEEEIVRTTPNDVLVYVGYQPLEGAEKNNLSFNKDENQQWEAITADGEIVKDDTSLLENRTNEYDNIGDYVFLQIDESKRKFETALSMKETNIDDNLLNNRLLGKAKNYNTIIHVKDNANSIVKELIPIRADESAQGIDDEFANNPLHTIDYIKKVPSVSGETLKLSKIISGDTKGSDMVYNNLVEVVKVSNDVGRRQNYSIVGNQDPTTIPNEIDADISQEVSILPPFGQAQRYYYLGFGIASILIVGTLMVVAFTKKKDDDNGKMQAADEGK